MSNKISCLILMMLLATPCFHAAPAVSSEESSEIFPKALVERFKLLAIAVEEFGKMFGELNDKGPAVFRAVLKDPKILEVQSEEMDNYLKELRDYLKKSDQVKKDSEKDEVFDLFTGYTDIVDKFDSEKNKDLSANALLIEKSLEENGLKEIETAIYDHFKEFSKKFITEVEEYFAGLNDKEKQGEKEFMEWVDKLKGEKDVEKQIKMFDNLIDDLDSKEDD